MDIKEFFELSAGKWFSHRTSYGLSFKESENGKADIIIDILAADDPDVLQLCERHAIDPALAWGGARVTSKGQSAMSWGQKVSQASNDAASTLMIPIADANDPNRGQLLHSFVSTRQTPVIGKYLLGNDEALTLITDYDIMSAEERIWFASPNLRLRTTIFKGVDGFSMASFSSEIRLGGGAKS